tara:strand:- start:271 stop:1035 length:765 start_codon:yes stop_codon:yes gene_type:complete
MFFTNLLQTNLKTIKIAQEIIYYTRTESTMDDVWELYRENNSTNILVVTDNQINGKGQKENQWFSQPSKSITCSFLIENIFKKEKINLYSILIPVSIVNGINNLLNIKIDLKWPNDLMFKDKKLGGVLIESKINSNSNIFNIGIGLNVNDDIFGYPENLKNNVISLKEIMGKPIQRELLLAFILNELESIINQNNSQKIISLWLKYCNHLNKEIRFKLNNKIVRGIFIGINNLGQARIRFNNEILEYNNPIFLI